MDGSVAPHYNLATALDREERIGTHIVPSTLRIDFWHIETRGNAPDLLRNVLTQIAGLQEGDPRRLYPRDTKVIRLETITQQGNFWLGEFAGIRTRSAAKKGHIHGKIETLNFVDGEGLAEEVAFLIAPETNILALQANRQGATSSSVIHFLERFAVGGGGGLDLLPVPSPSGLERFSRLKKVSTFRVGLAKLEHGHAFAERQDSVTNLMNIASELQAPMVSLEVTVGNHWRKQGLSMDGIRRFVQELLNVKEGEGLDVEQVQVTGRTEDDERDVLDLVLERLRETVYLEPDEGRSISLRARWQKLIEAYAKHEAYLTENFRVAGD